MGSLGSQLERTPAQVANAVIDYCLMGSLGSQLERTPAQVANAVDSNNDDDDAADGDDDDIGFTGTCHTITLTNCTYKL